MTERRAFLDRVRSAGRLAELPSRPASPPVVSPPALPDVSVVAHFAEQVEAVDGIVHYAAAGDVPDLIGRLLAEQHQDEVIMWADDELPVPGIAAVVARSTGRVIDDITPRTDHASHNQTYTGAGVGITGADAGLAESGSIIVTSGAGRPRMASVIPLVHIAVLPASRIYRSLTDYLVAEPGVVDKGANVVAITGPSRTADIEQELNLGVHGPGHLHVIVVESL